MTEINAKWILPEEYMEFLQNHPESLIVETEDYGEVEIFGTNTLLEGQNGYAYNPVTQEAIGDWNPDFVVIASAWGDPFCIDISKDESPVYYAFHGENEWNFEEEYKSIGEFLNDMIK